MDTEYGPSKVSYSEIKKFGQYGIVLSGLEAVYSNKKALIAHSDVFNVGLKRSLGALKIIEEERIIDDIKKVFSKNKYKVYREAYKKIYSGESKYK